MASREELQQEIECKMEKQKETLSCYFYSLGSMAFQNEEKLEIRLSTKLGKEAEEAKSAADLAAFQLKEETAFHEEYLKKEERRDALETSLEEARARLLDEKLKLGAIIYEQCSLSLLDSAIFLDVYSDVQSEKAYLERRLGKGLWNKFSSKAGLNKVRGTQDKRYIKYADDLLSRNLASLIQGDSSREILSKVNQDDALIKSLSEELYEVKEYLEHHQEENRRLERTGLEESAKVASESAEAYYDSVVNYGNYLYEKGSSWIGENTPSEVLDLVESIIKAQDEYSSLCAMKERLRKEAKADDYKSLIEQERAKILILNKEKQRIDMQIAKHENEIEKLEMMIGRLETR